MYGRISDPGMETYPPRGALALCTIPNQSAIGQWGWGFHTVRGGFDPGDHRFSPQSCRCCRRVEGSLIRGWDPAVPGWRCFILEPQPISDWPVGLEFPHRAGRFRPPGSPFSSPGCRSCRYMEGFLNQGWGPILPGSGEIVGLPRGSTPAVRPSPPHWPRAGCAGALGQWDRGSENAGMKVICRLYYIPEGT